MESFTSALLLEWTTRWLSIDQAKDVEHLLSLMVRVSVLEEKGSKTNRGYKFDVERILEMGRLVSKN